MEKLTDHEFNEIVNFVQLHYGINLEKKKDLIIARLSFELDNQGYSYSQFIYMIKANPNSKLAELLINKLSTNYTFFFREWDYIKKSLLSMLKNCLAKTNNIKIWISACSTGQEAYSLAMNIEKLKEENDLDFDYHIYATDINTEVLGKAIEGKYSIENLTEIPAIFHQYIIKDKNQICMSDEIKKHIHFEKQNLLNDFKDKFHMIFCRNVMIYFKSQLRDKLIDKFYDSLLSGGYILVGATETMMLKQSKFDYIVPSIYCKRSL